MRREKRSANGERDSVDRLAEAWEAAVPAFSTNSLHVFGRIQHLARFYEDALAHVARRHGLIPSDVYVLLALRRASHRLNPAELIEELSVTSGAVTKRIDRLASLNLVERHPDEADGRGVKIALTPRGHKLVDDEILFADTFPFEAVYALSKDDRSELTALLRRLLSSMEREAGSYVGPKGALRLHDDVREKRGDVTTPRRRAHSADSIVS
jgi:DNA-binding MarR family transcriptional regulator